MKISDFIKETKLTITTFASCCGLSYPQLHRTLRGASPKLENAYRIITFSKGKISLEDFLSREKVEQINKEIAEAQPKKQL